MSEGNDRGLSIVVIIGSFGILASSVSTYWTRGRPTGYSITRHKVAIVTYCMITIFITMIMMIITLQWWWWRRWGRLPGWRRRVDLLWKTRRSRRRCDLRRHQWRCSSPTHTSSAPTTAAETTDVCIATNHNLWVTVSRGWDILKVLPQRTAPNDIL